MESQTGHGPACAHQFQASILQVSRINSKLKLLSVWFFVLAITMAKIPFALDKETRNGRILSGAVMIRYAKPNEKPTQSNTFSLATIFSGHFTFPSYALTEPFVTVQWDFTSFFLHSQLRPNNVSPDFINILCNSFQWLFGKNNLEQCHTKLILLPRYHRRLSLCDQYRFWG